MTLTEHIQEVGSDIQAQQMTVSRLESKKTASIIAASVSATALFCLYTFASLPVWNLMLLIGLAIFASYNIISSVRELSLTNDLLKQNRFYHRVIVEEAYSGKEIGPKFD